MSHPLPTPSSFQPTLAGPRNRNWRERSRYWPTLVGLTVATGSAFLLVARRDSAQNGPATTTNSPAIRPTGTKPTAAKSVNPAPTVETAQSGTDNAPRRPLDFYTGTVRSGLFSAPQPPAPKPPKPIPVAKPKPAPKPIPVPVAPINPFAGWAYTGVVKMGDQTMALLENAQTKEGQYVRTGDSFLGAQVTDVNDQMVSLSLGGKPTLLAKSDNVTTTPLDKSAGFLSGAGGQPGQPGQPQPGQPPQAGQWMSRLTAGGPTVTLPNGVQLPAARAARRTRRLNRQF